eukprot:COSAG02_NODE_21868_length_772_cov_0.924220_1_plen_141_part_10
MQKIDLATTRIIVYRKPQRACRNSEPTIVAHVVDIVIVTIILAADTGTKGREDSSDPFAIVSTHQMHDGKPAEQKFVTQKIMQTLDPAWNETFFFDIWDLDAVLYLDIYDSDVDQDDYLGQGKLSLRDYCIDTGETHSHTV